ncbi:GNAT family N-acetyltransferase [Candidatus Bipolaricaulota bacterium]
MRFVRRLYQTEEDYWKIREFLRDVFLQNERRQYSWPVARLDYWRWHVVANCGAAPIEEGTFLWETEEGRIVAVLNCEDAGHAYLQVDPRFRTQELEEEMLCLAEDRLTTIDPSAGRSVLVVGLREGDTLREEILKRRGYVPQPESQAYDRYRDLSLPIPEAPLPDGYTIRPMTLEDIPLRSWASWRVFHPNEPDEHYKGHDWFANVMKAPMYRRDLDLVAVDADGGLVAFCTIWYDDVARSGYYEPVGTMPEHRRRGLCTALLHEGMRRLVERGAIHACIGGGGAANPVAEGVYSKASTDEDSYTAWRTFMDGKRA